MNKIVLGTFLVFLSTTTMAIELKQTGAQLAEVARLGAGILQSGTEIQQLEKESLDFKRGIDALESVLKETTDGDTTAGTQQTRKTLDDLKSRYAANQARIQKLRGGIGILGSVARAQAAAVPVAYAADKVEAFGRLIETMNLESRLNNVDVEMLKADVTLDRIESKYDNTMLGAYVKEKFGLFVNSNLICQGVKRCNSSAPTPVPASEIEKLFGKSAGARSGDEYYKKAQSREKGTQ